MVNWLLTAAGSDKEVRHREVDLAGTGITYHAGDSIAVHATNDPALVDAVLTWLGVGPAIMRSPGTTSRSGCCSPSSSRSDTVARVAGLVAPRTREE